MTNDLEAAAEIIQSRAGLEPVETAFVVAGGLGDALDSLEGEISIPYAELPGFPRSSAYGQENRLVIGKLEGVRIAALKGRTHYYETGEPAGMAVPLEVMTLLGATSLVVTSTCGSVDADIFPGSISLITDHINFNGMNPLIGTHNDGGATSLTKAYDERLNARLKHAAAVAGVTLREGIMMQFSGPTFETPAEVKMARLLGGTVIGHAGVADVILARRLGLRVCALSAITYFGAGFNKSNPTTIETRDVARQSAISLRRLVRAFLRSKDGGLSGEPIRPTLRKQPLT